MNVEYVNRIFDKVLNNKDIDKISPKIGKTLVDNARSTLIMKESIEKVDKNLEKHIDEYEASLRKKYPIKSNVRDWLNECLNKERVILKYLIIILINFNIFFE